MAIASKIFFGKVMHHRLFPKENAFIYRIFYLALPLSQLNHLPIAYNKKSFLSFYDSDHGNRDGGNLQIWIDDILKKFKLKSMIDGEIILICLPRIFGYVFNPISFWLCYDSGQNLRAILCEVNNTFAETHSYLCVHDDCRPITGSDLFYSDKMFHVSPFLERSGHYQFRFHVRDNQFSTTINYFNKNQKKQLITNLTGALAPMNQKSLRKAFFFYPLITFKAIFLIHWQAMKLVLKSMRYIPKPQQKKNCINITKKFTKL